MPKVSKFYLILTSGIVWAAVGIMLFSRGIGWILNFPLNQLFLIIGIGFLIGILKNKYMITKFAKDNIVRINNYEKDRLCFWAFQTWTSYLMIIFMMGMGIFLRNSPYVPKYILSPIYMGIGWALFLSSFHYFVFLYQRNTKN